MKTNKEKCEDFCGNYDGYNPGIDHKWQVFGDPFNIRKVCTECGAHMMLLQTKDDLENPHNFEWEPVI